VFKGEEYRFCPRVMTEHSLTRKGKSVSPLLPLYSMEVSTYWLVLATSKWVLEARVESSLSSLNHTPVSLETPETHVQEYAYRLSKFREVDSQN
jgi:hypothetical protein